MPWRRVEDGLADYLGAGPGAELGQDVRDVRLYRVAGQEQRRGHVRIGAAVPDQVSDLHLGRRQRLPPGRQPRR